MGAASDGSSAADGALRAILLRARSSSTILKATFSAFEYGIVGLSSARLAELLDTTTQDTVWNRWVELCEAIRDAVVSEACATHLQRQDVNNKGMQGTSERRQWIMVFIPRVLDVKCNAGVSLMCTCKPNYQINCKVGVGVGVRHVPAHVCYCQG